MILFLLTVVAAVAASPAPPWWAVPLEHILSAWGSAFIVALVPTGATVIRGIISHREHAENQAAVRAAVGTAEDIKAAVREVHAEVQTANGLKLGQMADVAESRRVAEIPPRDRTEAEQAHIDVIPDNPKGGQ